MKIHIKELKKAIDLIDKSCTEDNVDVQVYDTKQSVIISWHDIDQQEQSVQIFRSDLGVYSNHRVVQKLR